MWESSTHQPGASVPLRNGKARRRRRVRVRPLPRYRSSGVAAEGVVVADGTAKQVFRGAREGNLGVARSSVPGRVAAVAGFVLLWITGGPWQLLLFGAVDLAGLLWMCNALRSSALSH